MGSLYAATDPCHPTGPNSTDPLIQFEVLSNGASSCNVTVAKDAARGKIVMEDTSVVFDDSYSVITGGSPLNIVFESCTYPACWDFLTFCNGDSDGSNTVDTVDWPPIRDSFFKCYPNAAYNPCGDFNRDGCVDTVDWPALRDNFFKTPAANCTPGDINGVYCP